MSKKKKTHDLITNWHVVTARNPFTNLYLFQGSPSSPIKLTADFHGKTLGTRNPIEIPLLNDSGVRVWLEHPRGRDVDLVAIPFHSSPDIAIYDIDLSLADFDIKLNPSEAVRIIGFPEGLTQGGYFPIWKTGHMASDVELDWNSRPTFLIDATTKGGMSGSPVIAKRIGLYQTSQGNKVGNAVRFLGVYSGREISQDGIEVGFVWKPQAIIQLLPEDERCV